VGLQLSSALGFPGLDAELLVGPKNCYKFPYPCEVESNPAGMMKATVRRRLIGVNSGLSAMDAGQAIQPSCGGSFAVRLVLLRLRLGFGGRQAFLPHDFDRPSAAQTKGQGEAQGQRAEGNQERPRHHPHRDVQFHQGDRTGKHEDGRPNHPARESGLAAFGEAHLADLVTGIHVLPFYPSSSDNGFAVKDYFAVDPAFGTWAGLEQLGRRFALMFDAVFNHLSAQGAWFQRFLAGDAAFRDFFVTVDGEPDLSRVVRPRAWPLLTDFATAIGPRKVWTTFSADQADLNFKNPAVLVRVLEVLLFCVAHGAR
jgi:hypothetical protein